jgi:hypothetical protein
MSQPPTTPPQGGVTADQSMEDILASIRRILNEDEAAPAGAQAAAPAAAPARAATDAEPAPLILTEEMMVSPPAAAPEAVPTAPPVPEPVPEPAPLAAGPSADALLAPAVAAAAAASVGRLLQAVSADRTATVTRGGPSIEAVVREELRPLLKDWLDQHLPGMVERLVRAEIERVVGRALT